MHLVVIARGIGRTPGNGDSGMVAAVPIQGAIDGVAAAVFAAREVAEYGQVQAVETLAGIEGGKGGYWEDNVDYEWYAGI